MISRNYILATAGHVDHGKSSIVKALTGTDPDRLPEEKSRGITIDLGFAYLPLDGTIGDRPARFQLGIVDVPGHEDFVRNMVAGVGSIDLALLIVAADDGWMPQTEEHLQILAYLGVTRAVVALTKIDLALDETAAENSLRQKLQESPFADAPIVRTSIAANRGIEELKAALRNVLQQTPEPRDIGKPRLSIDRVFMLRGIGQVVTGTLTGGQFRKGQEIVLQPSGKTGRIRSLQNHNRDVEASGPGTRTALSIPDLKGGPAERGEIVTLPSLGGPSSTIDCLLEKSPRLSGLNVPGARPLKDGARIRMHLGSTDVPARVLLLDTKSLQPGGRVFAQLRLEKPLFAFAGDRFIVRDWPEQATLAGGVILDPLSSPIQFRTAERKAFLETRASVLHRPGGLIANELRRAKAARKETLLVQSRFSASEIAASVSALPNGILEKGDWVVDASCWERMTAQAAELVDRKHTTDPASAGLPLAELKGALDFPAPELFDLLVRDLLASGFVQRGIALQRASHRPSLPPYLAAAGEKVRKALSANPLDPPSRKEIANDNASQQVVRFLVQTGEAVEVGPDLVMLTDACARAKETIIAFLKARGSATASDLRQALGTSRRVVIPLLERFDKEGLTRREGDKRVLRQAR